MRQRHQKSDEADLRELDMDVPLRALAFRPMLHLGLRLLEPRNFELKLESFGYKIGTLLTSGARSFYEKMALAEGGRLIMTEQLSDATGWKDRLLDFDRLTPEKIGGMFDRGAYYARSRLKNINLRMRLSAPADDILKSAANGIIRLFNGTLSKRGSSARVGKIDAGLYVLEGKNLKMTARAGAPSSYVPSGEKPAHIVGAEIVAPELYCYHERCAIIASPAWWWDSKPNRLRLASSFRCWILVLERESLARFGLRRESSRSTRICTR